MLKPNSIKKDFPVFNHHPDLVYLDSAASSLTPRLVIEKVTEYYEQYPVNIHRGIYKLSERASTEYEETRKVVASFIHALSPSEIIFTRNATEGINLIASTIGTERVGENDEIVTTVAEHHANFVPWQELAVRMGGVFKVIDINTHHTLGIVKENEAIDLTGSITAQTKIVALQLVSNTLGTIHPVKKIIAAIKKKNPQVITIVDAAQAVPHMSINVQDLGCDFLVYSSHKMLGPTGVGVLWGRQDLLKQMQPYQFGGDMIDEVSLAKTTYASVPHKFEAGTPHIAGVIGLKAAIQYINDIGLKAIAKHEHALTMQAIESLQLAFGDEITILGPEGKGRRAGLVSFTFGSLHPHDIAQILDESAIAVRAGHHCTMPLHKRLGIVASTRASFYLYNTEADVEALIKALQKAKKLLS